MNRVFALLVGVAVLLAGGYIALTTNIVAGLTMMAVGIVIGEIAAPWKDRT